MATGRSMRLEHRTSFVLTLVSGLLLAACTNEASTLPGDSPADAGAPSPLGNGLHIAEINALDSGMRPIPNQLNVAVTGATFIIKDEYAETGLASSVGTIYVQDFHPPDGDAGATPPYSGMDLYKTTFEPASLGLAPGDVVDFIGEYQQYNGPTSFSFNGQYQPEMYEPIVTFRFDYSPPLPTPIPYTDLASWATGYKWMSMLVTVGIGVTSDGGAPGITGGGTLFDGTGRCKIFLTGNTGQNGVAIDNELYNLNCGDPKYATAGGVHFKSVTGVVTYFGSFTLSPRSDADIVLE
jgi:hypothetical protein